MEYVECPAERSGAGPEVLLFLGGGITGCPDWQAEAVRMLSDTDLTLLNPRRKDWGPGTDPVAQIEWEHRHMGRADAVLLWFCAETLCPITLFELGKWVFRPKKLFVGCAEGYARALDVETQVRLERPLQKVHRSLDSLLGEVREWAAAKSADRFHRTPDQGVSNERFAS